MNILFVAVFSPTSTNNSQSNGFKKLGHNVIEYNYREKAYQLASNVPLKYAYKLRDKDIINTCADIKSDITIFSKCNTVDTEVIKQCNRYTKTVLWFMDYIYTMDEELLDKVNYCKYNFISRWDSFYKAKELNDNTFFLQEGFDEENNIFIDNLTKKYNVSFIGNLNGAGCHFDRQDYYNTFKFNIFNNVYNKEHSKVVCETKINLNFSEGDGTSDRLYKLLASKGFVLTQPWKNLESEFTIGKDLDIFTSKEDLKEKINYYINNDKLREEIALNGYNTVQKYSRTNWAKTIIERCL